MKLKVPVWLRAAILTAVAGVAVVAVFESKDGQAWKRFKRHSATAIQSRSLDEAKNAIFPPPSPRIVATIPYNGFGRLVAFDVVTGSPVGRPCLPLVHQPDERSGWVYFRGDVEWRITLPKGRYAFIFYEPGALTKRFVADWDGRSDVDLGRVELLYGDLDADDYVSNAEAAFLRRHVGTRITKGSHLWLDWGDIDRNKRIDEWEARTVARNVGLHGDHRLAPMFISGLRSTPF